MKKLMLTRANFALAFPPDVSGTPVPTVELTLTTVEPSAVFIGRELTTEERLEEFRFVLGIDGIDGLIKTLTEHRTTLESIEDDCERKTP